MYIWEMFQVHWISVIEPLHSLREEHKFERMKIDMKIFKYVTYQVDIAKESKTIGLVMSE